ncbi:MAG: peptide chain release factor 2 [Planctomycetaceae bacterium]|nr:peptide chain release factor 2 [Planctomycetaceae bacterium]
MDSELQDRAQEMVNRIVHLKDSLDYDEKESRVGEINSLMAAPDFWNDQERAEELVGELKKINNSIKPLKELVTAMGDIEVLIEFAEEDESSENELTQTLDRLDNQIEAVELQAMMSSPEDSCNAYVAVQAGEGGTDSSDWAEMLLRMFIRWAEIRGYDVELLERSDAEEAGIRNATILIKGDNAYGYLRGETGNHRLIRISPFDSAGRRHTSFAAVDITPEVGDNIDIEINWDQDVREDTYRASGAGGQHVNKTDSAIRLTHLPTNVVVQCQSERSQHKNRASARKMLQAKLYQIEQEKRDAELAARRGQKSKIGFGGETIRNYVLHPDQYVKDARTGFKVGNPQTVLDGGLDPFLEAFLKWQMAQ